MTERVGRYELLKTLVKGDRGKLYLAKSSGFGGFARHVVVKTFEQLPGAAEGPFLEETVNLGRLHHQHITPILDVGRDGDRLFVALDFVHGRSAREVWQQAFTHGALLPFDFAFTVVAALASGLHYAHTRRRADGSPLGLVHGHVSLSNVLLGFDGCVQLIGFAGASARGLHASETQLGFSKDQLAYLAPEQARRQGLDARSDVFALGVILYELTTMRRAFRDDSDRLTIERVKIGSYVKPRSIRRDFPIELERVITRALQIDPAARYPDIETMRRELTAVGHHLELVLGDAAVVEVMAQLFDDSTVDPWMSAHADTAADTITVAQLLPASRRSLRAATETVDALAIALELPMDDTHLADPQRLTTTTRDGAALLDDTVANPDGAALLDDTYTTNQIAVLETRAVTPVTAVVNPHATKRSAGFPNDTDGVPVLARLPIPPSTTDTGPTDKPGAAAVPPAPRRRVDYRIVTLAVVVLTIGVTTVLALTLRRAGESGAIDASTPATTALDAAAPVDVAETITTVDAAIAIDAAVAADASTTIRLRITSTPPAATVLLDGRRLGKTPFEGVVDRGDGKHVLKVRLTGYATVRVDVDLGADVTQDLTLVRVQSDARPPDQPPKSPARDEPE